MPKHVNFEFAAQRWDQYRRFYREYHHCGVVQFHTGELIVTRGKWDPDERGRVNTFGLSYHLPTDPKFSYNFIDPETGDRVLKTWLGNGVYMVDHETKQLLLLGRMDRNKRDIPADLAAYSPFAYAAGSDAKWVSGADINVYKTMRLPHEQKKHLAELRKACMAADRIGVLRQNLWVIPVDKRGCMDTNMLNYVDREFASLTEYEKARIAREGFVKPVKMFERKELVIG